LTRPQVGDRDFKKKFKETVDNQFDRVGFEGHVIKSIKALCLNKKIELTAKAEEASRRFFEFFDRLFIRYSELGEIEWEMYYLERLRDHRPMRDVQTGFVNRTESFHQQLYATLSAFIKLLSHVAPGDYVERMPFQSTSRFLNFLETEQPELRESISILKRSVSEYRSRFVDHTNQNPTHDWGSYSGPDGKARILYYTASLDGNGRLMEVPELSIGSMEFHTSRRVTSYFVPPYHREVLEQFMYIMSETLANLNPGNLKKSDIET
jgi:hypothetical protein